MSNRFHNKYHRHNHHTVAVNDPRYPDASHDPIASPDSPFLGPFVLFGPISAVAVPPTNFPENYFPENFGVSELPAGIFVAPEVSAIAVQVEGSITITGTVSANDTLYVPDIVFTGDVISTYSTPVTATGEFLVVSIGGINKAIRLWQYE